MHSPAVVSEQQNPSWFQVLDDVPGHGLHLAGADGGEDEDEGDHVQAVRGEGWLPLLGDVADPAVAAALAVLGMVLHQLDGSLTVVVVSRDQTVFSTLIGPELQSVNTPAILCHKEPARHKIAGVATPRNRPRHRGGSLSTQER